MTPAEVQGALALVTAAAAGDQAGVRVLVDGLDEPQARATAAALAELAARLLAGRAPPAHVRRGLRGRLLALATAPPPTPPGRG